MHTAITVVLSALALAGCTSDDGDADSDAAAIVRVVIPDTNLREPGVSCSGAAGFRFAHPDAAFVIQDPSGTTVLSGKLPQGVAEKTFTIDLGDGRQPTVCVMSVDLTGVSSLDDLTLVIGDRSPVPIVPNPNLDGALEAVLS